MLYVIIQPDGLLSISNGCSKHVCIKTCMWTIQIQVYLKCLGKLSVKVSGLLRKPML